MFALDGVLIVNVYCMMHYGLNQAVLIVMRSIDNIVCYNILYRMHYS